MEGSAFIVRQGEFHRAPVGQPQRQLRPPMLQLADIDVNDDRGAESGHLRLGAAASPRHAKVRVQISRTQFWSALAFQMCGRPS